MNTFTQTSSLSMARLTLIGIIAAGSALLAADGTPTGNSDHYHGGHGGPAPAKLVETVRNATRQFIDVNATGSAGYQPAFGCVSGPDHGAMGIHYINGGLVGDGLIDASQPEALIYEPGQGGLQLVGVEYIVDQATWDASHSSPPMLEGQAFQIVGSPNRYGLKPFYELHVWAWRDNPNGAFVDWNTRVSCEGQ